MKNNCSDNVVKLLEDILIQYLSSKLAHELDQSYSLLPSYAAGGPEKCFQRGMSILSMQSGPVSQQVFYAVPSRASAASSSSLSASRLSRTSIKCVADKMADRSCAYIRSAAKSPA